MTTPEGPRDNYNPLTTGTTLYTIESWDTLSKIAKATWKSIGSIAEINEIKDNNKIRVWQKIYLTQEAKDKAAMAVWEIGNSYARVAQIRAEEARDEREESDEEKENIAEGHADTYLGKEKVFDEHILPKSDRTWIRLYAIQHISPKYTRETWWKLLMEQWEKAADSIMQAKYNSVSPDITGGIKTLYWLHKARELQNISYQPSVPTRTEETLAKNRENKKVTIPDGSQERTTAYNQRHGIVS